MNRSIAAIVLCVFSFLCEAEEFIQKCGHAKIVFNSEYKISSSVQLNWGASHSCEFEYIKNNRPRVGFLYKYVPFESDKNMSDRQEKLISEFYAHEKNIYRLDVRKESIGGSTIYCIDKASEKTKGKVDISCIYFKNKAKRELTVYSVDRGKVFVSEIFRRIDLE